MSSSNVVTTEQIEAAQAWIQAYYECLNSNTSDIESWLAEFCQPDAILIHGSLPAVKGYKEIVAYIEKDRAHFSANHIIKRVDVLSDRIYSQVDGIFICKNDPEQKEVTIKGIGVFHKKIDEKKASSIVVYMDPTPLIERMRMIS